MEAPEHHNNDLLQDTISYCEVVPDAYENFLADYYAASEGGESAAYTCALDQTVSGTDDSLTFSSDILSPLLPQNFERY